MTSPERIAADHIFATRRYFEKAPWQDAEILPPPTTEWGGGLPTRTLPPIRHQIGDDAQALNWPLQNTIIHYAALLTDIPKGDYEIRVRAIDANGMAQPLPAPSRNPAATPSSKSRSRFSLESSAARRHKGSTSDGCQTSTRSSGLSASAPLP